MKLFKRTTPTCKCDNLAIMSDMERLENLVEDQEKKVEKVMTELFKLNNPPKFKKGQKVTVSVWSDSYSGNGYVTRKESFIDGVVLKFVGNDQYSNEYLVETGEAPDGYRKVRESNLELKK